MRLPCAYQIGQLVYHRLEPEVPMMITKIVFLTGGTVVYHTTDNTRCDGSYYELEITSSKSFEIEEPENEISQANQKEQ